MTDNIERSVAEVGEVPCEHCGGNGYSGGVMPAEDLRGEYDFACEVCCGTGKMRHRTEAEARVGKVDIERLTELLFKHDPMCGHEDCRYTARKLAPHIAALAALKPTEPSEAKVERVAQEPFA